MSPSDSYIIRLFISIITLGVISQVDSNALNLLSDKPGLNYRNSVLKEALGRRIIHTPRVRFKVEREWGKRSIDPGIIYVLGPSITTRIPTVLTKPELDTAMVLNPDLVRQRRMDKGRKR